MSVSVLLYSGGLDSYCAAHIAEPDVLLTVDTGTAYGQVELDRMTLPNIGATHRHVVLDNLSQWERADLILPGRNAHLALAAAQYGDTIYLGATAGDRVTDKDVLFAHHMTTLLAHLYQPQWWIKSGARKRVELPVKDYSKGELVAKYLELGGDPDRLVTDTFSCYYPRNGGACGECKPCVRRYIALLVNGITPDVDCAPALHQLLTLIRDGQWDRGDAERDDVIAAYKQLKEMS